MNPTILEYGKVTLVLLLHGIWPRGNHGRWLDPAPVGRRSGEGWL